MVFLVLVATAGCRPGARSALPAIADQRAAELRARAAARFDRGDYYKPRPEDAGLREAELAPLIVQQARASNGVAAPTAAGFGAVRFDASARRFAVDPSLPTVYTAASLVVLGGTSHEQLVYVWWYEAASPPNGRRSGRGGARSDPMYRGVRITLGTDGFPMVWEVLSGDEPGRILFVSASLEQAARSQYGDPLPGRSFAVERAVDETPDVLVVRVLDDGPVAMGPYVYLEARNGAISAVLCRCSPSQCDHYEREVKYELVPFEFLDPPLRRRVAPPLDLTAVLRWPSG